MQDIENMVRSYIEKVIISVYNEMMNMRAYEKGLEAYGNIYLL